MARESRVRRSSFTDALRNVERVARTGGGDSRLGRILRPSFPALVVLIIAAGTALVTFAYTTRDVQARPVQNDDHWHSPYGVWDCTEGEEGEYLPQFSSTDDGRGIHSHNDGLIHIHPYYEDASGENATLEDFMTAMRAQLSDDAITLDDGRVLEEGVDCGGEPAIIQVHRWEFANSVDEDADVFTENLNDVRFRNNGEAWVIARAPEGVDFPPPPSLEWLGQVDPDALRAGEESTPLPTGPADE